MPYRFAGEPDGEVDYETASGIIGGGSVTKGTVSEIPADSPPSGDVGGVDNTSFPTATETIQAIEKQEDEALKNAGLEPDDSAQGRALMQQSAEEEVAADKTAKQIEDSGEIPPAAAADVDVAEQLVSKVEAMPAGEEKPPFGPIYNEDAALNGKICRYFKAMSAIIPKKVSKKMFDDTIDALKAVDSDKIRTTDLLTRKKQLTIAIAAMNVEIRDKIGYTEEQRKDRNGKLMFNKDDKPIMKKILKTEQYRNEEGKIVYDDPELIRLLKNRSRTRTFLRNITKFIAVFKVLHDGWSSKKQKHNSGANFYKLKKYHEQGGKYNAFFMMKPKVRRQRVAQQAAQQAAAKSSGRGKGRGKGRGNNRNAKGDPVNLRDELNPSDSHFFAHVARQRMQDETDEFGLPMQQMRSMNLGQDRTVRAGRAVNLEKPAWMARLGM